MDINSTPHIVMSILKSFDFYKQRPRVRLTKIGYVDGREPKIPIGQVVEGYISSEPKVGCTLNMSNATIKEGGNDSVRNTKGVEYESWCTSIIQKILSDDTFQTKNSIYKLELFQLELFKKK